MKKNIDPQTAAPSEEKTDDQAPTDNTTPGPYSPAPECLTASPTAPTAPAPVTICAGTPWQYNMMNWA